MDKSECSVCGREVDTDIYGSRCEDCWAAQQRYDQIDPHQGREALNYLHAALAAG